MGGSTEKQWQEQDWFCRTLSFQQRRLCSCLPMAGNNVLFGWNYFARGILEAEPETLSSDQQHTSMPKVEKMGDFPKWVRKEFLKKQLLPKIRAGDWTKYEGSKQEASQSPLIGGEYYKDAEFSATWELQRTSRRGRAVKQLETL